MNSASAFPLRPRLYGESASRTPLLVGLTLLSAILLGGGLSAWAQLPSTSPSRVGFDADRLEVTHATVKRFVDEGKHAGLITLLARDGKIADVQMYGYRDLEKKLLMTRDTICRVYSMSKIITSVGVLALLEDGRFNLEDPITTYLPELKDLKVFTAGTVDAPHHHQASPHAYQWSHL